MLRFTNVFLLVACVSVSSACRLNASEGNDAPMAVCPWEKATSNLDAYKMVATLPAYTEATFDSYIDGTAMVTAEEVREDLACLKLIMTTTYSGTAYFKDHGVDLVARVEGLSASIHDSMSKLKFAQTLRTLHDGAFDQHVAYGLYDLTLYYQAQSEGRDGLKFVSNYGTVHGSSLYVSATIFDSAEALTCPEALTLPTLQADLTEKFRYAVYRSGRDDTLQLACHDLAGATVDVTFNRRGTSPTDDSIDALTVTQSESGVELLRIHHFPQQLAPIVQDYIAALTSRDVPLIIDVRGVGGGAPPLNEGLTNAIISTGESYAFSKMMSQDSIIRYAGFSTYFQSEVAKAPYLPLQTGQTREDVIAGSQTALDDFETNLRAHIDQLPQLTTSEPYTDETFVNGTRAAAYTSPIVLIIDRRCGSQCEFFAAGLRHHPKVTVIGAPTAGRLQFGSDVDLFLPHSGVRMVTSVVMTDFTPAIREGEGLIPDYYVEDHEVIETALALLKR